MELHEQIELEHRVFQLSDEIARARFQMHALLTAGALLGIASLAVFLIVLPAI